MPGPSGIDSIPVVGRASQILAMFLFNFLVLLDDVVHSEGWELRVWVAILAWYVRSRGGYVRARTVAVFHVMTSVPESPTAFIDLAGEEIRHERTC